MEPALYRAMQANQADHWWFAGRREVLRALIRALALPPGARILEIGCGTGGNLALLKEFGALSAVEDDDYARSAARAVSRVDVRKGSLPDALPFAGEAFDLVCLLDVLEHVADERAALVAAGARLREGGRLLITVPAYAWLFGPHDRAHRHFRRYTAGRLRQAAEQAELRPLRLGYFNTLLFPLLAALRLYERAGGGPLDQTARPASPVNRALYRVFAAEGALTGRFLFPFGASVAAVLARA